MLGLEWARIYFIENPGMAFGITFGGDWGKLFLTLFRIVMTGVLLYILIGFIKEKVPKGFIVCFALIIAGALGNTIDCMFYGLVFSESLYHGNPATFMPEGGGYAPFLFGKVVDMFYFPMVDVMLPEWVPFRGGTRFEFFRPVFNVADAAISVGVAGIILFYRKFFLAKPETPKDTQSSDLPIEVTEPIEN